MERSDYWAALAKGWWLIAILGLAGFAAGFFLVPHHPIQTSFNSTSAIGSLPGSGPSAANGSELTSDQILYYASSDQVLAAASKESGLNWPTFVVRDRVNLLGPPPQSGPTNGPNSGVDGVIDVQVGAPTVAESVALNVAFDHALGDYAETEAKAGITAAEQQTEDTLLTVEHEIATQNFPPGLSTQALDVQVNALQTYLASLVVLQPNTGFTILKTPVVQEVVVTSTATASNSRPLRAAAGLLIGMALGALAALALWLLDRRLKTAKRAQTAFGYPVVAEIPVAWSDSTEPYRMLWLSVFREPLPLPPVDKYERLYDEEDPVLDDGVGSRPR